MLCILWMFISCPLMGQPKSKKLLTAADYPKWGTLFVEALSEKGNWVAYTMRYEELQKDTLFLKNTKTQKTIVIPTAVSGKFNKEQQFACLTADGVMEVNLKTAQKQLIQKATDFAFSTNGKYLLMLLTTTNNQKKLVISDNKGKKVKIIENVTTYKLHEASDKIVCTIESARHNAVIIVDLKNSLSEKKITESPNYIYTQASWNSSGNALAFFEESSDKKVPIPTQIGYFNGKKNQFSQFSMEDNTKIADSMRIDTSQNIALSLSDDGLKVFFGIKEKKLFDNSPETVQIWKTKDNWIYPKRKKIHNWRITVKTAVWNADTNQFLTITDPQFPKLMLDGKQQWALVFNPMYTESQYQLEDDRDYYVRNLTTGTTQLVLKRMPVSDFETLMIPNTNYFVYYQNKNWWLLDCSTQQKQNLTEKLVVNFENSNYDRPGYIPSYGIAAYNTSNNSILFYDQYDIWEIAIDSKKANRLTHGREQQICFRIQKPKNSSGHNASFNGTSCKVIDLEQGLVLEATDPNTMNSGYYSWNKKDKESKIIFAGKCIDQLFNASKNNSYLFREQDYDSPPSLIFKSTASGGSQKLFQSNPQHYHYYWGKAELIHYQNPQGKKLKGILYYPANYDPKLKYPMIVDIYEKQSDELHLYVNPTELELNGTCSTNFISQGYFYLKPDIVYEIGKPAIAALECVTAATQSIIDKGLINPNKIGLTGHSYGGYESCFIATQTNLFATAVIGAAATNLNSYYFATNWDIGKPHIWRIENQQWRMGKSLFEDWEGYNQNSPIYYTKNVSIPLLIWTGEKDQNVNTSQTIEFYLALKRLNKEAIMLYYPNEGHALVHEKTQRDLTRRMQNWFDYFLKDQTPASWILDMKNN